MMQGLSRSARACQLFEYSGKKGRVDKDLVSQYFRLCIIFEFPVPLPSTSFLNLCAKVLSNRWTLKPEREAFPE